MQLAVTSALQNDIPCTASIFTWADTLMYGRNLGNPTHPHIGRTLGPIEQNHAIMQQISFTYGQEDENIVVTCVHNRSKSHAQHPSITEFIIYCNSHSGRGSSVFKESQKRQIS